MTSRSTAWLLALSLAVASLAPVAPAHADHRIDQPFTGTRPLQLEFHGGLAWYGFGFAGGARFGIPLLHNGFIPSLNNAVYLNFGVDFYFVDDAGRCFDTFCEARRYRFAMGLPVALHWEFYFNDTWSAFAELGVQVYLPPSLWNGGDFGPREHAGQWVIAAVGGSLHLGDTVALTLRVGNPYISFGVTLKL
jgi:hypothetical protein